MPERRNIFLHGLSLTLRRLPALLWAYVFNLALAFLFSLSLNLQLSKLLNHSLAAQRLSSGFDLGTIGETYLHLHEGPIGDAGAEAGHASIPLFVIQGKWADNVDDHIVGRPAFFLVLAGNIVLFLVASILRLYFDLVEVY